MYLTLPPLLLEMGVGPGQPAKSRETMDLHTEMTTMGEHALTASRELARLSSRTKNNILLAMADEIDAHHPSILDANSKDIQEGQNAGLSKALLDRLLLTDGRLSEITRALRAVAGLKDPIGTVLSRWIRPNGLEIIKQRVPIGVIAIIYESRPNVTVDSAGLCIKTSNATILRGGKEAMHSNVALVKAMIAGGIKKGLPPHAVQFVQTTDYQAIRELVQLEGRVDLVIPRGGEALIRSITENARVPVIKHYKGVCHVYVDESANPDMALKIIENAKCQRPGTCNAAEKLLVHEKIADTFLPVCAALLQKRGVELRGDAASRALVPSIKEATEGDWFAEYLDLILAVRIVPSVQAAVDHINHYGSRHSDAIVATAAIAQRIFTQQVDSAAVYVNASTRFTDGGEFGMGAEIGISTDKIHARGPMALEELTTYKYAIRGNGQIRT
jgi:glutamate-5-semialdehyde dehydrogenase